MSGAIPAAPWEGIFAFGALAVAIALWLAGIRPREPIAWVRPVPTPRADRDMVSVAVESLRTDRLTPLLASARQRLNTWSVESTGRTLDRLPGLLARIRRRPSTAVREVRRFDRRLRRLLLRAWWKETGWLPRLDPWRSSLESRRAIRSDVALFFSDLEGRIYGGTQNR